MVMTTTPVRSMRSLHPFTHGVNGQRGREAASAASSSPSAGRRLHPQRSQELNPSHGNAGTARRSDADRGIEKGEL
jgi:hypothetical protein